VIFDATTLLSVFDRDEVNHWAVTGTIAPVDPGHLASVAERCGSGASLAAASSEVLVEQDSS